MKPNQPVMVASKKFKHVTKQPTMLKQNATNNVRARELMTWAITQTTRFNCYKLHIISNI